MAVSLYVDADISLACVFLKASGQSKAERGGEGKQEAALLGGGAKGKGPRPS